MTPVMMGIRRRRTRRIGRKMRVKRGKTRRKHNGNISMRSKTRMKEVDPKAIKSLHCTVLKEWGSTVTTYSMSNFCSDQLF